MSLISKKIVIVLLCIVLVSTNIYATVSPTINFFVNDYAGILNEDTEQYIVNVNTSLQSQTGAQVVVVTVENLEEQTIEEYSTTLFRNFGIGDKTKNNGVLLLLALEERQFRVEVGYGLEGALNDAKTGRIQDQYIIPYLKQNKWDEGIRNGFDAVIQEICDEYQVQVTSNKPVELNNTENVGSQMKWVAPGGFITGAIIGIIARIKKWKFLKSFGIGVLGIGAFAGAVWLILPDKTLGIVMAIMSAFCGIISFFSFLLGRGSRFSGHSGGGGFSGGGYSGGGGRSGGGGSTRSF